MPKGMRHSLPRNPDFRRLDRSVLSFGAMGDGVHDDSKAIQRAVDNAEGRPVLFPARNYLIGSEVGPGEAAVTVREDDVTLCFEPGATVQFVGEELGSTGLRVSANDFSMQGGDFWGTWDLAGQGTPDVMQQGNGTSLVELKSPGTTLQGFNVRNARFSRAAGRGLFAREDDSNQENYGAIAVHDCLFTNNYVAIQFNNNALSRPVEGVSLSGLRIRGTGNPGPTVVVSTVGGNAITTVGPFEHVLLDRLDIQDCGRMSIEMWLLNDWILDGRINKFVQLRNSRLGAARYRTLSMLVDGLDIMHNNIRGNSLTSGWLELAGANIRLRRNQVYGQGWTSTELPNGANTKTGYSAHHNTFVDVPSQGAAGAVNITHGTDVSVVGNRSVMSNAVLAGSPRRAAFDVLSSIRVRMEDNHVEFNHPCNRDSAYTIDAIRDGRFVGNTVAFSGIPDGVLWAPFNIGRLQNCIVNSNLTTTNGGFTLTAPSGVGAPTTGAGLWRRRWNGSTFDVDDAGQGVLNDPPANPSIGDLHVVGDSPSGLWVGSERTFAQWDGAVWEHEPWDDVIMNLTGEPAWNEDHLPASGGTQLLTGTGWVLVELERNNFTAHSKLVPALGAGLNLDGFEADASLVWDLAADRNVDPISIGPKIGIAKLI